MVSIRSKLAAIATALLVFPLLATPAQAEEIRFEMHTDEDPGDSAGSVYFRPDGDKVTVCDDDHDDDALVRVQIINVTKDPNRFEYKLADGGDSGCASHSGGEGQPYQLAEGHCFQFRIWLEHPGGATVPDSYDDAQWRNYNHAKQECPGVD